jgi:hypothetical protein
MQPDEMMPTSITTNRRNAMQIRAMLSAALLVASPAWAVNKCVGADGKIIWQDTPCAGDSKNLNPASVSPAKTPTAVMSPDAIAKSFDRQMEQPETRKKIQAAAERRELSRQHDAASQIHDEKTCGNRIDEQPAVGMTESRFLQCTRFARTWDHLRVNETETRFGVSKQYVYASYAPIRYVHVINGTITAISR